MALNKDKFIELLRGKIDSWEKWKQVCVDAGLGPMWNYPTRHWGVPPVTTYLSFQDQTVGHWEGMTPEQRWWAEREVARQFLGVYPERTTVMKSVSDSLGLAGHFIHISRDDPSMVAYTPSIEYGLADRQVKMAFGKLLRKLVLLATDTHIQRLEASHRSELDPSFRVARTIQEIEYVYRNMAGDSGCMRHPPSEFNLPDHIHPSHAYSYAGLGVAYHELDGRVVSRSVIYDNPDNPEDKRYVRIYGDGALRRKLEMAGYKLGTLQGAKLRALHLKTLHSSKNWEPDRYVIPYLDGPAGAQETREGSYAYLIKGEDCLRVTSDVVAQRLHAMGFHVPRCKSTGAIHQVTTIDPELLQFTCGFSGKVFNSLETTPILVFHEGQVKKACQEAVPRELCTHSVMHFENGKHVSVLLSRTDYDTATFYDRLNWGTRILATPENRKQCGYVLLHPAIYGDNQWATKGDCVPDNAADPTTWFKRADCVMVFDETGAETWVPQAKLDELRAAAPKMYKNVAPQGATKAISHVKNPRLVTTLGKRTCIKGWHNVVELYDGNWDYEGNCRTLVLMGRSFYISGKQNVSSVEMRVPEQVWATAVNGFLAGVSDYVLPDKRVVVADTLQAWLRRGVDGVHFFKRGEMLFRGQRYENTGTVAQMRTALAKLKEMSDEQISEMLDSSYVPYARAWQAHGEILVKLFDAKLAEWEASEAARQRDVEHFIDSLDSELVVTATHIREERLAAAA